MVIAHLTSNNAIQFKGDSSCRFHQVSSELTTQNLSCFSHGRNERYGPQRVQAAGSIDVVAWVFVVVSWAGKGSDKEGTLGTLRRLSFSPLTTSSHCWSYPQAIPAVVAVIKLNDIAG
jgi:hypothetical protein